MFNAPDVDEVVAVAARLGITISADEAAAYQRYVVAQMTNLDEFVQSRMEEHRPPMLSPSRAPGYRPSAEEDPLNAWVWKCRIEGVAEGPLAGKTVSFKDHVAVAGMPMSIGSFALEGFTPDFDATIVTRVLAAGGTIVGKNTMNGLSGGFGSGGGIGDYGRPRNPHEPEFVTGGSSAGSAAAIAAGEVDIAFGGDQGGSIRIPAGDEVYGDNLWLGGFAEYALAPESALALKPPALTFAQASTIPQSGAIALQGTAGAAPGVRMLINGGGGGSGAFAIQLAMIRADAHQLSDTARGVRLGLRHPRQVEEHWRHRNIGCAARYERLLAAPGGELNVHRQRISTVMPPHSPLVSRAATTQVDVRLDRTRYSREKQDSGSDRWARGSRPCGRAEVVQVPG